MTRKQVTKSNAKPSIHSVIEPVTRPRSKASLIDTINDPSVCGNCGIYKMWGCRCERGRKFLPGLFRILGHKWPKSMTPKPYPKIKTP